MLIVQMTDLHVCRDGAPLYDRLDTRTFAASAVDAANAWAPDAVFVTGDLVEAGTDEEYRIARAELDRLDAPFFVIPGNHDLHSGLRTAFQDHGYLPGQGPMNWVMDQSAIRVIALDSVVPGAAHGMLARQTLDWLDAQLAASDKPTLIGLHHPPFHCGIPGLDGIMCLNGADMAAIVARHAHVERVVAGHHHRSVQVRWAGTVGLIAPSVAHQVRLSFDAETIPAWKLEPPGLVLHRWSQEAGLVTHQVPIGSYDGPYAFRFDGPTAD